MSNSFVHALLLTWGEWHIRQAVTEPGWSSISALSRMMAGTVTGAGVPGHRILAADMTPDQARTHRNVMALPDSQRIAVTAKYCGPRLPNAKLAEGVGMASEVFRGNLARGRAAIARAEKSRAAVLRRRRKYDFLY